MEGMGAPRSMVKFKRRFFFFFLFFLPQETALGESFDINDSYFVPLEAASGAVT